MPLSDSRRRANAKYNAKAYEQLMIRVKTGERDTLKQYAESKETSLNNFVCNCVSLCIEKNLDVSQAKPLSDVLPDVSE